MKTKLTLKEIAEKNYNESVQEAVNKGAIVVTDKDQANQIFEDMKSREVDRLNFNFKGTMQFLIDVRDKLNHPEKMVRDIKGLQNLQKLIDEYINISTNLALTMPETCHFEGNEQLVKRNADYNVKAIKSLKKSLKAIKGRIKKRETDQLNSLPKSLNSKLSDEQLLKLRDLLITGNYIANITEVGFIYIFREQPIREDMTVIQWKKSKVKAKKLLNVIIGEGFSNPTANKCFISFRNPIDKIFDSNVKLTTSYPDIDGIIRQLK